MKTSFDTAGLSLEQAPPISIPLRFFLLAPIAWCAAGLLFVFGGNAPLISTWAPMNIAAVHLGTLGFLGAVMIGALYQMVPVVAGSPVPKIHLAKGVHGLLIAGVGALVYGQATGNSIVFLTAAILLAIALLVFWFPTAIALVRAPTKSETVWGMRVAMVAFVALTILGIYMAYRRGSGDGYTTSWTSIRTAHAAIGFTTWVGGLLTAVSWQVVPMFYLTPELPLWSRRTIVIMVGFTVVTTPVAVLLDEGDFSVIATAAPAALAVWCIHPITVLMAIARRRRRRKDPSLLFWRTGLICAPIIFVLGVGTLLNDTPVWLLAFGWLIIGGWAGLIIHGMLTRIVPFLVWFHRFAPLVGKVPIIPMRRMLSARRVRVGFATHMVAVIMGLVAIISMELIAARMFGASLIVAGCVLGSNLITVARLRPMAIEDP